MSEQHFFVGMDLGSFKTSMVASTGRREVLPTAIGRPKDMIARGLLKAELVFGDAITRHRMALNVVRPLAKGAFKYTGDADTPHADVARRESVKLVARLVQHAVQMLEPPAGVRIYGAIGAPSRAARENKQFILDAAHAAMDAVLVVHEPFAVAYGMNCLDRALLVDIGAGTTDICPMYGSYTAEEDQLTLGIGGDHIDQQIIDRVRRDHPQARLSELMARRFKEKYGTACSVGHQVRWEIDNVTSPQSIDLAATLHEACQSIVAPIANGIRRVVARFDPDLQQGLLENIVLAGGGSRLTGLDIAIEQQLAPMGPCRVSKVSDAVFAGAAGALKLAMAMPHQQWARLERGDRQAAA